MDPLERALRDIAQDHHATILKVIARAALPASVTRVFQPGTKTALVGVLSRLPVDEIPSLGGEREFRGWFERQLELVADAILAINPLQVRRQIHPGYKWGHGTKVLALYVRDVVLYSRYFSEAEVELISPWLSCPIDGIVLEYMRRLGVPLGVAQIKEIDTREKYWAIQDRLEEAATAAKVARVWFDDVWVTGRVR